MRTIDNDVFVEDLSRHCGTVMDLLTEAEVSEIVKKIEDGNARLVDYELGYISEETVGYLGTHLSLTLNLSSAMGRFRRRLFLKTYQVRDGEEDFLGETGIFKREQDFYSIVLKDMKECVGDVDWCPEYIFSKERVLVVNTSGSSTEHPNLFFANNKKDVLTIADLSVLEDLSEKLYRMIAGGRRSLELDGAHLETTLKTLASVHVTSLLLENRKSGRLPALYPKVFDVEMLYDERKPEASTRKWISWQVQDLLEGVDHLDKYSHSEKTIIKDNFQKQIMRIYPLSKKSEKYRNVLTHGDTWKNNLLFFYHDYFPKKCKLVDFQFIRYAPPAHDVMHFLHYSTNKETRDREESRYLGLYYDNLKARAEAGGIDIEKEVTEEEFQESCKEYKELALIQCLLSLHYIMGTVTLNVEAKSYEKYEEYLKDHRKEYMVKFFRDESYAEKIKDIFHELIDTYILNR